MFGCVYVCVCISFGNMCTCIYCVLYCLYCVFCIVSFMCTFYYLFCLYCHRGTTQFQLLLIIIIIITLLLLLLLLLLSAGMSSNNKNVFIFLFFYHRVLFRLLVPNGWRTLIIGTELFPKAITKLFQERGNVYDPVVRLSFSQGRGCRNCLTPTTVLWNKLRSFLDQTCRLVGEGLLHQSRWKLLVDLAARAEHITGPAATMGSVTLVRLFY
jgi:hypothetical protein